MRARSLTINGHKIENGLAPYVIAEMSGNHHKDINIALKMIEVAAEAGADAVKLQTYTADSLTVPSQSDEFMIKSGTWAGRNLYELYQEASTPYDWFPKLFEHGRKLGITIFSSPFDADAVDLLEGLDAPAYKIASNELTDWPLIERVAQTGKPMILSAGTAELSEIELTVGFLEGLGVENYALLHCVSAYPAPMSGANMRAIEDMRTRFNVPIGFSDHTLGITAPIIATSLGAAIIEKHFILDRSAGGPDSSFAIEPDELKALCTECQQAHAALGEARYGMKESEKASPIYKRHFYTLRDIKVGETFSFDNIKAIRARSGIPARDYRDILGKTAKNEIRQYEPVNWEHVDD
jgi:N-acetylneuraminate synthase